MTKNYKALAEAIIESVIIFLAWPRFFSPPHDTGSGNVVLFILILILSVMLSSRVIYCFWKFTGGSKEYNAKERAMKKENRARIEAIIWVIIIIFETIWFLTYFQFGDMWFNAVLPAMLVSIAAMLIRMIICVFKYKNIPLPWEKSTSKNYTALIEAVICTALIIGAPFWIRTLPQDTGYGGLILELRAFLICQGLFCGAAYCVYKFIRSVKE